MLKPPLLPAVAPPTRTAQRQGFTLVEMLVVVAIILVLTTIAIVSVNAALSSDRVAGSARQVQSYLEGARDRAIFAKKIRGVRFLLDPNDATVVSSMVYIGEPQRIGGVLRIAPDGYTLCQGDATDYTPPNSGPQNGNVSWQELIDLGLISTGTRIRIADSPTGNAADGLWYSFDQTPVDPDTTTNPPPPPSPPYPTGYHGERLKITALHPGYKAGTPAGVTLAFEIELAPGVLPGSDPVQLVQGIVIDLDQSRLPSVWKIGSNYSGQMDLLFSPEGRVTGPAVSSGLVHLMVVDNQDRLVNRYAGDPDNLGDSSIITVITRTGHVATHAVMVEPAGEDINGNTIFGEPPQADPFYYAQTGDSPDEK